MNKTVDLQIPKTAEERAQRKLHIKVEAVSETPLTPAQEKYLLAAIEESLVDGTIWQGSGQCPPRFKWAHVTMLR